MSLERVSGVSAVWIDFGGKTATFRPIGAKFSPWPRICTPP
jgi:hypothetical protein